MLFHTYIFFVFFAVVFTGYYLLKNTRFWLYWLFVSSYVFYGWWNPLYLILIAYSTAVDYVAGRFMEKSKRRKLWLAFSLVNNLGLLGFFKYADFFAHNLTSLLASLGITYTIPAPDVLLPVGISFYTFQSMSYTIDLYRGQIKMERSFIRFATFVSFFPQLVAGPIERASNLLPQFYKPGEIRLKNITDGASLFLIGFFKKVAMADFLASYADKVYNHPTNFGSASLALGTLAFGWQIYFDFSGYTDMARGVARMMGFNLMLNFRHPYLATGIGDFWSRWHISLSTWFKDYVYIPLGGNRRGSFITYRNLFITMVVSGFWHGAAWTFVIWGALHALGSMTTRELERSKEYREKVPTIVKQIGVYLFVNFAWIFFRAQTLDDAFFIIRKIFAGVWDDPRVPLVGVIMCLGIWGYQYAVESAHKKLVGSGPFKIVMAVFLILYLVFFTGSAGGQFIYFQF